ncbi:MAG: hypothetical protein ACF8CQ_24855 [Rhodopirellula sp. JB044]|uniref:hypothetical protein n=1 Tax=Rhodopirellula sp. JB044 TaxID=3342844 RepID=UPI00370B8045
MSDTFIASTPLLLHAFQVDDPSVTTLCEKFEERRGTYNHAWNAPNYVLSRYVAGASATTVAWSEYQVLSTLAHLTSVAHVTSSVKGDITIDIQKDDGTCSMKLVSPESTVAIIGIPKASIEPTSITANGTVIWKDGSFTGGAEGITDAGSDDGYIKFKVAAGSWELEAR